MLMTNRNTFMSMEKTSELNRKAVEIRLNTLDAIFKSGTGYIGSCMSVVEIMVALYYGCINGRPVMNYDPLRPGGDDHDYLILSKGHAVAVQYSILADLGFFDKSELDFFAKPGSMLQDRPNAKVPGVNATMLSYGHGLSVAFGIALAAKMDRKNRKTFAVLGDGELLCGQVWEAAEAAARHKLNNLVVFVDNNKVRANSAVDTGFIQDKFEAFGWEVIQVTDGHNFDKILYAVSRAFTSNRRPVCIWCHTVVGKGVEFAERKASYHWAGLSEGEMSVVMPKLKEIYEEYSDQLSQES